MKTYWALGYGLHEERGAHCGDCVEVVLASEAREEVEKARAKGKAQGSVQIHNTKEENDRILALVQGRGK